MKKKFEKYLIEHKYKKTTPSGLPSTVYDYCNRVDAVAKDEGMTWEELAKEIKNVLPQYDKDGIKQQLGEKSHHAVINALRRFSEFLESQEIIMTSYSERKECAIRLFCKLTQYSYPTPIVFGADNDEKIHIKGERNIGLTLTHLYKTEFHNNKEKGSTETIDRMINIISREQNISEAIACEQLISFFQEELGKYK